MLSLTILTPSKRTSWVFISHQVSDVPGSVALPRDFSAQYILLISSLEVQEWSSVSIGEHNTDAKDFPSRAMIEFIW